MTYYKRISDNNMNSDFVDGSLLLHTDMNEIETLTKAGINANYEDIQKMQDGTITVQNATNATNALNADNATTLNGASLSKYADETLQNNDNKVPTAKQVKQYVDTELVVDYDDLTNRPSINGVVLTGNKTAADLDLDVPFYYWDGTNTPANVTMFNEICQRYTNGYPFILMGRVEVQNGYYDENGDFVDRTIPVVTEISVKNMEPYESPSSDRTFLSFMTQPIKTTGGYAIGSIHLIGTTWGEYTEIQPMSWSYTECPITAEDTVVVTNNMPTATWNNEGLLYKYVYEDSGGLQIDDTDMNLKGFVSGRTYKCIRYNAGTSQEPNYAYRWFDISKINYLGEALLSPYYTTPDNQPKSDLGKLWDLNVTNLQPGTYLLGLTDVNEFDTAFIPSLDWYENHNNRVNFHNLDAIVWSSADFDEEEDTNLHLLSNYAEFKLLHKFTDIESLEVGTVIAEIRAMFVSDSNIMVTICEIYKKSNTWESMYGYIDQRHRQYRYPIKTTSYSSLEDKPSINSVTLSSDKTSNQLGLQDTIQYSTMPTASSTTLGKIVQYIGTTDSSYTHGYYYQVISDGASTPTYSWSRIDVQPSGGGGSALGLHILTSNDDYAIDLSSAEAGDYIREDGMMSIPVHFNDVTKKLFINTFDGVIHVVKDCSPSVADYTLLATYCGYNQGEVGSGYVERNSFMYTGLDTSYGQAIGLVPNGNDSTIYGKKTFDTIPETNANTTPTTDWQLVNKKYVDDNAGGGTTDRSFYIKKVSDGTLVPCSEYLSDTFTYTMSVPNNSGTSFTIPTTLPITKKILDVTPRVYTGTGANTLMACGVSNNHAPLEIVMCYPYVNVDATAGNTWYIKIAIFNYSGNAISNIKYECLYRLQEDF